MKKKISPFNFNARFRIPRLRFYNNRTVTITGRYNLPY